MQVAVEPDVGLAFQHIDELVLGALGVRIGGAAAGRQPLVVDAKPGEAEVPSERRADAIKRYLVDKYGIASTDLVTVGYGKSKLKDPSNPMADVNRRVQVANMENKTTASK